MTAYHYKHTLRVLHRPFVSRPARPCKRTYDEAVHQALLWEVADQVHGEWLKPLLPVRIESMERHGDLCLDPMVRNALSVISAAPVDWLLRPVREASRRIRRDRWGLSSAIRQSLPVRAFNTWGEPPPGYCEADLVEHWRKELPNTYAASSEE